MTASIERTHRPNARPGHRALAWHVLLAFSCMATACSFDYDALTRGSGGGGGGGEGGGGGSGGDVDAGGSKSDTGIPDVPAGPDSSACGESWKCTEWSTCSCSGLQTRDCTDSNKCGTTKAKPVGSRGCSACGNGYCDCGETSATCSKDCDCTGSCAGKSCGDDGCGRSCGECGDGSWCVSGACRTDRFQICAVNTYSSDVNWRIWGEGDASYAYYCWPGGMSCGDYLTSRAGVTVPTCSKISCKWSGQKVCMGARSTDGAYYWGLDVDFSQTCPSASPCCWYCDGTTGSYTF